MQSKSILKVVGALSGLGGLAVAITFLVHALNVAAEVNRSPQRLTTLESRQIILEREISEFKGSMAVMERTLNNINNQLTAQRVMLQTIENYSRAAAEKKTAPPY